MPCQKPGCKGKTYVYWKANVKSPEKEICSDCFAKHHAGEINLFSIFGFQPCSQATYCEVRSPSMFAPKNTDRTVNNNYNRFK